MVKQAIRQQEALADFLAEKSHRAVGRYIAGNSTMQGDIQDFFGPELDMDRLIKILLRGGKKADQARDVVDRYVDAKRGRLAFYGGYVPLSVRFKSSRIGLTVREKFIGAALAVETFGAVTFNAQANISPITHDEIRSLLDSKNGMTITDVLNASTIHYEQPGQRAPLETTITGSRPQINVSGLSYTYGSASGRYRDWQVSQDVIHANRIAALASGFPEKILYELQGPESSFKADNYNEDSHACGLGQFVRGTLYEMTYKYADKIGFSDAAHLVERYVTQRDSQNRPYFAYRAVNDEAAEKLKQLCFDPDFNVRLKILFTSENVGNLQKSLAEHDDGHPYYRLKSNELYLAHWAGVNRGRRMLIALNEGNGDKSAASFFPIHVSSIPANLAVLYHDNDTARPRSVSELLDFIADVKGFGRREIPDMRNANVTARRMAENLEQRATMLAGAAQPDNRGLALSYIHQ